MAVEYFRVCKPHIILRVHCSVCLICHGCRLPCPRYRMCCIRKISSSVNDRQGVQHIVKASPKAFGTFNGKVFHGDTAAIGSRNDIHHLQLIRHPVAALQLGCFDPDAVTCAVKCACSLQEFICLRKGICEEHCDSIGILCVGCHLKIVLGFICVIIDRDETFTICITATYK